VDPGFLRLALALAREETAAGAEWFWPEKLGWLAQSAVESQPWAVGPDGDAATRNVTLSVVVAIVEGRRVWLVPGPEGPALPAGTPATDEGLSPAVRRVARERTGWAVVPGPVTGLYEESAAGRVDVVVRAEIGGGYPRSGDWHELQTAAAWSPGTAVRVADVLAFAGQAVFRALP
jgi:ADP-ribose pyrophosphatase YjhB (NUDIX family)